MPSTNEELVDEFIRHQIYIERFKNGRLEDLQVALLGLMDDVAGLLGRRMADVGKAQTINTSRLQALLEELGRISDQAAVAMTDDLRQELKDLAIYEAGFTVVTVATIAPVAIAFEGVAPITLWAAVQEKPFEGRALEQWFTDYSVSQRKRLDAAVRMSVVEGETIDQTIRRIRGTQSSGFKDGVIMGINRRAAEALARTAVNHVVTTARQQTLTENSEVMKGVLWRSTLDSRTSEVCMARDGKVYPLESGPRPPAHPNCRSTISPVLKSWKEMGIDLQEAPEGTRASLDGQVPASETYQTWLQRQPAAFQDDVLGRTKGRLFRAGELALDKFVDFSGRTYTLAELRKKHPEAFKKANV